MTPRRRTHITTTSMLKRRETQARAVQAAAGPSGEIARLSARVDELQRELALSRITVRALQRQLDDAECEED
jgi:hypothetical protein